MLYASAPGDPRPAGATFGVITDPAFASPASRDEFAGFIAALGRVGELARDLSAEEAHRAMALMLSGKAHPFQVGAFLALLRAREVGAETLLGFVRGASEALAPEPVPRADLDWPAYVDRRKRVPWFVLSALLLAQDGVRVLMHGTAGEALGCITVRAALAALGIVPCPSIAEAERRLVASGFAYLGLEHFCPPLDALAETRTLLGLRSPLHPVALHLNPSRAPNAMVGTFHPRERALHRDLAIRLGQRRAAIFHGSAGEAQRNPAKPCTVACLENGTARDDDWPPVEAAAGFRAADEPLDPRRVAALWRGALSEPGPVATVTGTAAIALRLVGRASSIADAEARAKALWDARRV